MEALAAALSALRSPQKGSVSPGDKALPLNGKTGPAMIKKGLQIRLGAHLKRPKRLQKYNGGLKT